MNNRRVDGLARIVVESYSRMSATAVPAVLSKEDSTESENCRPGNGTSGCETPLVLRNRVRAGTDDFQAPTRQFRDAVDGVLCADDEHAV